MNLIQITNSLTLETVEDYEEFTKRLEAQLEKCCSIKNKFLTKFAICEAVENAIEHGKFPISVELRNEGGLSIKVTDTGAGFLVQEKSQDDLFSKRGRGIYMMSRIAASVQYNRIGNIVLLSFE